MGLGFGVSIRQALTRQSQNHRELLYTHSTLNPAFDTNRIVAGPAVAVYTGGEGLGAAHSRLSPVTQGSFLSAVVTPHKFCFAELGVYDYLQPEKHICLGFLS